MQVKDKRQGHIPSQDSAPAYSIINQDWNELNTEWKLSKSTLISETMYFVQSILSSLKKKKNQD